MAAEKGDKQTSVLYIDSPCFTQDIDSCRNYSEIRILPDMSLQPCILRSSGTKILDLSKEKKVSNNNSEKHGRA